MRLNLLQVEKLECTIQNFLFEADGGTDSVQAQVKLESATAKIHEEWRTKRQNEFAALGTTTHVACWRRVEAAEADAWCASLEPSTLSKIHRYCPAHAANPTTPAEDGMTGAGQAVHWVDLNSSYWTLPESWKAKNRVYAKVEQDDDTSAAGSTNTDTASKAPPHACARVRARSALPWVYSWVSCVHLQELRVELQEEIMRIDEELARPQTV